MNKTELKDYLLSEEARLFIGWDFSYVENRMKQEPLSWSYRDIVNTYSGQINNPFRPENLYRKCGFQGNDIWHVLKKRS